MPTEYRLQSTLYSVGATGHAPVVALRTATDDHTVTSNCCIAGDPQRSPASRRLPGIQDVYRLTEYGVGILLSRLKPARRHRHIMSGKVSMKEVRLHPSGRCMHLHAREQCFNMTRGWRRQSALHLGTWAVLGARLCTTPPSCPPASDLILPGLRVNHHK